MQLNNLSKTQKLTISGLVIALYIVILSCTQSFSFGSIQVRIATSLYALSYVCPFLVLPLGIANFLSNMIFGGFGLPDMIGGVLVGMGATSVIVLIRKLKLTPWLMIAPIILIPGLFVPIWMGPLLGMSYSVLATNICLGQIIPAICGVLLIKLLQKSILAKGDI